MKLYIVVNKDLEMSSAKLSVQVGHACTTFSYQNYHSCKFEKWFTKHNQTKIILKATEKDLKELEEQGFDYPEARPIADLLS